MISRRSVTRSIPTNSICEQTPGTDLAVVRAFASSPSIKAFKTSSTAVGLAVWKHVISRILNNASNSESPPSAMIQ